MLKQSGGRGGTEGRGDGGWGEREEASSGTGDPLAGAKCQSVEDYYVLGRL